MIAKSSLPFLLFAVSIHVVGDGAEIVDEPYTVFIVEDGYVRCGPSDEFYRTDRVNEGDKLEVYIETNDGWLGVRPPDTSFCWLPEDQVVLNKAGDEGRIIDREAVAWIGTNLGRARKYRWQIKFEIGEQVAVIGKTEREVETGEMETWYQIVPPAGEFRWVHDSQIAKDREQLAVIRRQRAEERRARVADNQPRRRTEQVDFIARGEASTGLQAEPKSFDADAARQAAMKSNDGLLARNDSELDSITQVGFDQEIPTRPIDSELKVYERVKLRSIRDDDTEDVPSSTAPWVRSSRKRIPIQTPADEHPLRSAAVPMPSANPASDRTHAMQVEFARLLAIKAGASQLESLRSRAQNLATTATDPSERGRARILAERIAQYQDIDHRRNNPSTQPATSAPAVFVKEGWLQKVYSARPDAPDYALTDRDGRTIAYVSPSTGQNISRYLNKEVGIVGKPRYLSGIETPHYVADRIVAIKR